MATSEAPVPRVTRIVKKEATRLQLIGATIDVIAANGFADLTLSKVSDKAKVSRGLVNFHFTSKEQLLVETLRHLTSEYRNTWRKAYESKNSPAERLAKIVETDFHPKICNTKTISVWYAFWGEAKSRPVYREVSDRADDEFARIIENLCREIITDGNYDIDPILAAKGLRSMIDGLWLELLLSPQTFNRNLAISTCMEYLSRYFPLHFVSSHIQSTANQNG